MYDYEYKESVRKFETWLDEYVDTKEHSHNCAAHSEGQPCCLDKHHPTRLMIMSKLEELIGEWADRCEAMEYDYREAASR